MQAAKIDGQINQWAISGDDGTEIIRIHMPATVTTAAEALAKYDEIKPQLEPDYVPPPVVPERVSARQFKLQLLAAGLLDQVETWIASQDQAVQIAYANSGTFLRTEPMMQSGFTALGFTSDQIDAFYMAAAAL